MVKGPFVPIHLLKHLRKLNVWLWWQWWFVPEKPALLWPTQELITALWCANMLSVVFHPSAGEWYSIRCALCHYQNWPITLLSHGYRPFCSESSCNSCVDNLVKIFGVYLAWWVWSRPDSRGFRRLGCPLCFVQQPMGLTWGRETNMPLWPLT